MITWTEEKIKDLLVKQKEFFASGVTLPIKWRIEQIKKLKQAIINHEEDIEKALYEDLGRDKSEAYFCDIGTTIVEANEAIHGLKKWSRPEKLFSGFLCFPSLSTRIYKMPYGNSLIISPFNFPIYLSFGVLVAAIAGGNTAVIKVSSKSKESSKVMEKIISEIFPKEFVCVIGGGHDIADICLNQRFDKIFYTGSPNVAKHVMERASVNLTPLALELGGETGNWCVIRKDANIKDAARKIAFFKACNSGQICININQVAVAKEIARDFVKELKNQFIAQLGEHPENNKEYAKLVSTGAYEKCLEECNLYKDRVFFGGKGNAEENKFSPTIIYPVKIDEPIVQHELFNPLLPIVEFEDDKVNDILKVINQREHGLSLYLFTKNIKWANKVMQTSQYGGGCINEVCVHMMVKGAPFNGTGHSGMGAYHGEWGFREFTHPSTVLKGHEHFNLPLREHPYNDKKFKLIKGFEK